MNTRPDNNEAQSIWALELQTKFRHDAAGIVRGFRYVYESASSGVPPLEALYTKFHTLEMARLYQRDRDGQGVVQVLSGDQWQRI